MKVAIIGHGKMGKMIEEILRSRGHHISCIIDANETDKFDTKDFQGSDVAIEFSTPATAVDNILHCFAAGVPVVSGTTGWNDSLSELRLMCEQGKGTLLYSSNFSIGVNIFKMINKYVANLMNRFSEYKPSIIETHHIHKLDHPSGTAITLGEEIIATTDRIDRWKEVTPGEELKKEELSISHRRIGEVPGIHEILWDSEDDTITLTHSAKSRHGFAYGAVLAAEWLKGKSGYYTMDDLLRPE